MIDQVEIHRLMQSKDVEERKKAVDGMIVNFDIFNNKEQAWNDLHILMHDEYGDVRRGATRALGVCYSQIPEEYRNQAWSDLHRLTQDNDDSVRHGAVHALGDCYSHIPEDYKKQAWDNLHRLTQDNDDCVRWTVADALGGDLGRHTFGGTLSGCYSHIPEDCKKQPGTT